MKLSFSTAGWPFSLDECVRLARETRYDGLEIAYESLEIFDRSGAPFSPGRLHETARALSEAALSVSAVSASRRWSQDEALSLIALAHDLRSPFVVLPLDVPPQEAEESLRPLLPIAEKAGVTLLIPTTGAFANTGALKNFLDGFAKTPSGTALIRSVCGVES